MKRFALYLGLATVLVASCSIQEEDFKTPQQEDVVYYASFEQPAQDGTRVYANEDLLLRWTADDRVSIFGKNTYNQQYKFLGETGDNSGGFSKVDVAEYVTGNPISHTVSVYPYHLSTKITEDEVVTLTLPAEQHYAENTFGLGANTMVSVSEDNVLQYKNVGGYLRLSLYGEGVSVSSITLTGNNGEKLAGKATVTMPLDGTPTMVLATDASDKITLFCDSPVALEAAAEDSKDFWFVVPPQTFSNGFTISVSRTSGGTFEKSTSKSISIERSMLSKMSPMEVEADAIQPNNIIYYTSSDGRVVLPNRNDVFGATLVSNKYENGIGVMTFNGDVTSVGNNAFETCSSLVSISLPNSVISIGNYAFRFCSGLSSFTIPKNVRTIPQFAFFGCSSLLSISIPEGVTTLRHSAFRGCSSLTSITIPESVISIEECVFTDCISLTQFKGKFACYDGLYLIDSGRLISVAPGAVGKSISIPAEVQCIGNNAFMDCNTVETIFIPENVTEIGDDAFSGCASLKTINLPEKITSISGFCFYNCSSLESIVVPQGVVSIGGHAFNSCSSLKTINIPDGVTSIEYGTFYGCSSLTSIILPDGVTIIDGSSFKGSGLTSITIPWSVKSIGHSAFLDCASLTSVTLMHEMPPTGAYYMFDNTNNCPIYVPAESVSAYKNAQYWNSYASRIQPLAPLPEAVDLGLPSGLKWASFNLGASKPEEYGDYYAWGEVETYYEIGYAQSTTPKWKPGKDTGYNWSTYKWCLGSEKSITRYCTNSEFGFNGFSDGKTVLELKDDVANVVLCGKWRIPTDEEWTELLSNCTSNWTIVNDVPGYRLTSRLTGNSIFLPAAGFRYETVFFLPIDDPSGHYWSSTLVDDEPQGAWSRYFSSGYEPRSSGDSRYAAQSIRPVYTK